MVPKLNALHRVVNRFVEDASVTTKVTFGSPTSISDDDIKSIFTRNKRAHVRLAVEELNLSFGTVWRILREKMMWKPCSYSESFQQGVKACSLLLLDQF